MSLRLLIIPVGLMALLALSCSQSSTVAGGAGGETTNGATACVVRADGSPAAGATVRLRRSDWVTTIPALAKSALYSADALTDSSGRFEITGIDPGSYRIEVTDGHAAVLLACSLDVRDTANLGVDTLRAFATITGSVDTVGLAGQRLYVQVNGLERLVAVNDSGRFVVADLPAGNFTVRAVTAQDTTIAAASNVNVAPGEGTDVTIMGGWRFSKRLYLNTTANGANVAASITGFPLLVRLDSTVFDFSQAKSGGEDVRFTGQGGAFLPMECELWDSAAKLAALWVRLDTVRGHDSTQYITMLCGNDTAVSGSNDKSIFDTADGYVGVWHFGPRNPFNDATVNGNNAVNAGSTPVPGITGEGRYFDGKDSVTIADTPSLEPTSFTVSCWFKRDGPQTRFGKLVCKGKFDSAFTSYTLELRGQTDVAGFQIATTDTTIHFAETPPAIMDNSWYFLTGVYNGVTGTGELFLNGSSRGTFSTRVPIDYYPSKPFPLLIGGKTGTQFKGAIDEVRLLNRPQTSDQIKLSYENQRQGSRLVIMLKY